MNRTTMTAELAAVKRNAIAGLLMIAAVLGAGIPAWGGEKARTAAPKDEPPLTAPVAAAVPTVIDDVVTAAGSLASRNTAVLSSKIMGSVAALNVREGDHVEEGKLLIRIESGEITAQAIQAQAAYNNAKLQYDRIKSLFDANAATQMEMEHATLGMQTAEAGLKAAHAMESYTAITAPISGQIVEKRINLGEMAMPGQPVLKIEDNDHLRLEVTVREADLPLIRPGKAVSVRIDAMPDREIRGRVSQVVPAADMRTHSFLVKVDLPAEKGLITGMYGKAFFSIGTRKALMVPRKAVVQMSGISGVYVVAAGDRAAFQMVQLGEVRDGQVEVLAGLKAGDRVVADNTLGRIEGRKIEAAK
jgi:membrane fusion protein, multidrug efflux system